MTKAGIVHKTEGFAKELAADGIRVNAVLPGLTETKFAPASTHKRKTLGHVVREDPPGPPPPPGENSPAVLLLCSPPRRHLPRVALRSPLRPPPLRQRPPLRPRRRSPA